MRILSLIAILATSAFAQSIPYHWVTVGSDTIKSLGQKGMDGIYYVDGNEEASILQVRDDRIQAVSTMMHDEFKRCGGFMAHETYEEAIEAASYTDKKLWGSNGMYVNYTIDKPDTVSSLIAMVEEQTIRGVILAMSQFHTRYYKSQSGVDSQSMLKAHWEQLLAGRSDAKVEFFNHPRWPQPSLVATIKGSTYPDEVIIIGGHADSINGATGRSPGADDNASGMATISEVIKVLAYSGYKPARTVKFMGYAAEEVGLWGSQAIAKEYSSQNVNVIGVLQLDMTNHKGTATKDIVMMSDYTNRYQNEFLGALIDTYLQIPWGYSRCGYGCSDHASWHREGYPASIPFESTMDDINHEIHTSNDTIEVSGGNANHAVHFARLATAFMVELAK